MSVDLPTDGKPMKPLPSASEWSIQQAFDSTYTLATPVLATSKPTIPRVSSSILYRRRSKVPYHPRRHRRRPRGSAAPSLASQASPSVVLQHPLAKALALFVRARWCIPKWNDVALFFCVRAICMASTMRCHGIIGLVEGAPRTRFP